ncbi:MAG: leucine-rich repeat protein, partial [Clostridia bacterium]
MKKSAKLMMAMLLVVLLVVTLVACGKPDTGGTGTTDTKYTISFDCNGGSAVADMIVDGKSEITIPQTTKEGYFFAGWFVDNGTLKTPFDLNYIKANQTLTAITLYAKWIKETSADFFEFTYTNNKNTAYSIRQKESATLPNEIALPSSYNGKPVTGIGQYAFYKCSGLTMVTIPNSVTSIEYGAFSDCSGLTGVTIPDSVTSISNLMFSSCTSLTSIAIPKSVININEGAFSNCTSLTSIVIPKSVTKIQDAAFYNCSGLISIEVEKGNTAYHSKDNCIIETANGLLILGCNNSIIPTDKSVLGIGLGAFSGCSGLTSIAIPASVTSIEDDAFSACGQLTSIAIPASVTYIGDGVFSYCNNLTTITVEA